MVPTGPIEPFGLIESLDSCFEQEPLFEYFNAPVFAFAHKTMFELPAKLDVAKEEIATTTKSRNPNLTLLADTKGSSCDSE